MEASHLQDTYRQLRDQLDAAYAEPVWDSQQIDRIADQMIPVEAALSSASARRATPEVDGG